MCKNGDPGNGAILQVAFWMGPRIPAPRTSYSLLVSPGIGAILKKNVYPDPRIAAVKELK